MSSLIIVTVINNNKVTKTSCKHDSDSTFVRISSVLERIFLFFLPPQPVANSGPRDVSAVKECFVPLFDSNMNPAKSSFRIVDCCEIHTHKNVRKKQFIPHKDVLATHAFEIQNYYRNDEKIHTSQTCCPSELWM